MSPDNRGLTVHCNWLKFAFLSSIHSSLFCAHFMQIFCMQEVVSNNFSTVLTKKSVKSPCYYLLMISHENMQIT